ncbi:MAG: adenosylmethionine--8-amino-7-oxononanoate transaminase [Bacteriovorax sp.]
MKIWRPYTQMFYADPISLKEAKGAYLITKDGRRIFDAISSWWLITHGHSNEDIAKAIAEQARKCEQVVFANFTHEAAEELAHVLRDFFPKSLSSLFFSDNGSTSVEVAMKMAYQYQAISESPKRSKFISFERAYHGDTCGAMSVGANSIFTTPYQKMRFEVLSARQGKSLSDEMEKWTSHFEELIERHSEEVCAVILEPILQGAGGMIVWPVEAVKKVCELARKHNALVIFDEVMTGFGRTGTMFAFEQVNIVPDFLCLSKGLTGGFLPLGLTVTTDQIYGAFLDRTRAKTFYHGHSFTGNALSSAAAVANLKLFNNMDIRQVTASFESAHRSSLQKISKTLNTKEVRTSGSIGVLELNQDYGDQFLHNIHQKLLEENIFIRPLGNTLYMMPPYCASPNEIRDAWEKIAYALRST